MSKKQDLKIKRWDRAIGGTNIAAPYGMEVEQRPKWLADDFVHLHILQEDPISLRDNLLSREPWTHWNLISNLLNAIERHAQKILEDDERRYLDRLTEDQFYSVYSRQIDSNTPRQANAIAALRSIEVIRSLTSAIDYKGELLCDPDSNQTYESLTVAKIVLEMMMLMAAAVRGELWENIWPKVDQRARSLTAFEASSSKANQARRKKYAKIAEFCRTWWLENSNLKGRRMVALQKELLAKFSIRKSPSRKTIRAYLKPVRQSRLN